MNKYDKSSSDAIVTNAGHFYLRRSYSPCLQLDIFSTVEDVFVFFIVVLSKHLKEVAHRLQACARRRF